MSGWLDPVITIDAGFLAADPGYALSFSDGITNPAPGVPEPTTWAMMLVGFGGLGCLLRRRRVALTA